MAMKRKAYGAPVSDILANDVPRAKTEAEAVEMLENLHRGWKWQTRGTGAQSNVTGGNLYAVTIHDWN